MTLFETRLNEYKNLVEEELENILNRQNLPQQSVLRAMRYSLMAGGKRIRPILTLEVCRLLGGDVQQALPFACAIECVHSYSLIHDDLPCMDDDDVRRGKPSCHVAFGESTALLAGDSLLTLAFETAANAAQTHAVNADHALQSIVVLASLSGVNGMIGGQVLDLESEGHAIDSSTLQKMHLMKTGALIQAACQMGAITAGADPEIVDKMGIYAQKLGLAFQICDDILDVKGDEKVLGKPIGSDVQQEKTNYIKLYGLERSEKMAAQLTEQAKNILMQFENSAFLQQLTDQLLDRQN